jgi:hypothetical protein
VDTHPCAVRNLLKICETIVCPVLYRQEAQWKWESSRSTLKVNRIRSMAVAWRHSGADRVELAAVTQRRPVTHQCLRTALTFRRWRHHVLHTEIGHEIPVVLDVVRHVAEERLHTRDLAGARLDHFRSRRRRE